MWWIFHVLLLVSLLLLCATGRSQVVNGYSLPDSEVKALYDLYTATNGEQWFWYQPYSNMGYPWSFNGTSTSPSVTSNPCSYDQPWQGISCNTTCEDSPCNVQYLFLSSMKLHGSLPESLSNLTALMELDVSNNNLTGTIPSSLSNLTQLQYLFLSSNQLTGTIPESIGISLNQLQVIDMYENQLRGTIPTTFGSLTSLFQLQLYSNLLTGSLPNSFGQLIALETLDVHDNQLTGIIPDTFSINMSLTTLDLSINNIDGSIPSSMGFLQQLQTLNLYSNKLTGPIPESFIQLTQLQVIDVDINTLSGTIPNCFGSLIQLWYFDISNNLFIGNIPVVLQNLTSLNYFVVNNNELTGTIPTWIEKLVNLQYLLLNANLLTGTIPNEFGNLYYMQYLFIGDSAITGSIPDTFNNLVYLQGLELYSSYLTGTIAEYWGEITQDMQYFILSDNDLTGTIPTSLTNMNQLQVFGVNDNQLHGTIPNSWGFMPYIWNFDISHNKLNGTIPSSLSNMIYVAQLVLNYNQFTGTLPNAFGQLYYLQYLDVSINHLEGKIPESYKTLYNIIDFILYNNDLTGSIASWWGNHYYLQEFNLYDNDMTGTIPSSLGQLSNLLSLQLSKNHLTGTIPSSLGDLHSLTNFDLQINRLHGTLPFTLGQLNNVFLFSVGENLLSGSISDTFGNLQSLQYLNAYYNHLTGTLPSSFGQIASLINIAIGSNHLTGDISLLSCLHNLQLIQLAQNLFSGSFPNIQAPRLLVVQISLNMFSGSLPVDLFNGCEILQSIDMNSNRFTGSLPASLFASTQLISVVLASNCFSGTLPADETICTSNVLTQLSLDGLHSAPHCSLRALPFVHNSGIVVEESVYGSIPACLLTMANLVTLNLGGNSFSGTIPDVSMVSPSIQQLVLCSNDLTGTIPESIWKSNIDTIDLSLNRLQGTLPSNMLSQAIARLATDDNDDNDNSLSVKLSVNQLSGTVPSVLVDLPVDKVDILEGNMFTCDSQRNDIPTNDPEYDSYNCGSDATNFSLVAFGCAIIAVIVLSIAFVSLREGIKTWYFAYNRTVDVGVETSLSRIQRFNRMIVGIYLLLGMLLYGILSAVSSSYSYSYVWSVSAIYKSGLAPFIVMFLFMLVCLALIMFNLHRHSEAHASKAKEMKPTTLKGMISKGWVVWLVILLNVGAVMTVNGLFVSASRSDSYTPQQMAVISIAVALFKIVWNFALLEGGRRFITIHDKAIIGLCLFNNLVAPFVAEMFVSSDCFLYIMSEAPSLTFPLVGVSCDINNNSEQHCTITNADGTSGVSLTLTPFFHYSQQCSFSLISTYSHVFLTRYIISGLIAPIGIWSMRLFIYPRCPPRIQFFLHKAFPPLWKFESYQGDAALFQFNLQKVAKFLDEKLRHGIITNLITDLSMLICFGAIFPPLALVIALSIGKDLVDVRLAMGRLELMIEEISKSQEEVVGKGEVEGTGTEELGDRKEVFEGLKEKMIDIRNKIRDDLKVTEVEVLNGLWWGLSIATVIWGFVLLDTLSVYMGPKKSIWVIVFMVVVPPSTYMIVTELIRRKKKINEDSNEVSNANVVEVMNPVVRVKAVASQPVIDIEMKEMSKK